MRSNSTRPRCPPRFSPEYGRDVRRGEPASVRRGAQSAAAARRGRGTVPGPAASMSTSARSPSAPASAAGRCSATFPTKEDLIAAIVVERMHEAAAAGRELPSAPRIRMTLCLRFSSRWPAPQQVNRGLFEAVADTWLANDEIRAGHSEIVGVLEGTPRPCSGRGCRPRGRGGDRPAVHAQGRVRGSDGARPNRAAASSPRHLDLVRAALRPVDGAPPLRGHPPTLGDIELSVPTACRGTGRRAAAAPAPAGQAASPKPRA